MDLVLLKVLNLSFELKPILPLVWTLNEAERQLSTYQPINHAWMILVSMNGSILRLMVGATLAYESSL